MKPIIDFDECLRDSPKFREQLETEEANIEALETKLDKVLKACSTMIDSGKTYINHSGSFTNALWDLSGHFSEDSEMTNSMNRMIQALQEMNKYHSILLDQASRTVVRNLTAFIKVDVKGVKESKHHFDKYSNELDLALIRNSQVSKTKQSDVEEIMNLLLATRSCFRHTALDHVQKITMLQARKRHEILATLLSYLQACCTYFHQGADLTEDLEPFLKTSAEEVATMRNDTKILDKEMENRHTKVNSKDSVLPSCIPEDVKDGATVSTLKNAPRMQGYLFKRTSNAFKTWNRRWFYLYDNRLVYRKRTGELNVTVMEEDLRLCTVKPVVDGERRFCFEVLSPTKSHMLQADSEDMLSAWTAALQNGISSAIQAGRHQHVNTEHNVNTRQQRKHTRLWEQVLSIAGNTRCCDCGATAPRWASINLGVTLCIECSGVHRSLGVHYSKVRSLTLDDWEPDIIKVMAELGNDIINKIYEANTEGTTIQRATPDCETSVRESWIRAKYVSREFVRDVAAAAAAAARDHDNAHARRWAVRRTRRRVRAPVTVRLPESDDKSDDANSNNSVSVSSSSECGVGGGVVVVVGAALCEGGAAGGAALVLPSDHDSTDDDADPRAHTPCDLDTLTSQAVLFRAARAHNLPVMAAALASGASLDEKDEQGRIPLHYAVLSGSVMACSFLLVNGSKLNVQDAAGGTPLHLATEAGHTAQVCLLLRHRADQTLTDGAGRSPLDIAVNNANADIVTLLRLTKLMNEEMRESESCAGDDTYNQVFRDYTQLAATHPERLRRNNNTADTTGDQADGSE